MCYPPGACTGFFQGGGAVGWPPWFCGWIFLYSNPDLDMKFGGNLYFHKFSSVIHSGIVCRPSESLLWEAPAGILTPDWTG